MTKITILCAMFWGLASWSTSHAEPCPSVDPVTGAISPAPGMTVTYDLCNLRGANFSGMTFYGCLIRRSNLSHANFSNAVVESCHISYTDLTYANFTNAYLADTAFFEWTFYGPNGGSDLSYAILTGANVEYTDFHLSNLSNVTSGGITGVPGRLPVPWRLINGYLFGGSSRLNLTGADLSNQDLSGVGMVANNLTNANLTNTNLTNSTLYETNLTNANLTNANLTNADMRYAVVSGVIWNNTTCVDGTNSDLHLDGSCLNPMDHDRDGLANATDLDDDGDGTPDYIDAAPLDSSNNSEIPLQTDGNYKGTTIRDGQAVQ